MTVHWKRLVLDASVLPEYIVAGSPYRRVTQRLFDLASQGTLELYVASTTLSELLYNAARVYQAAGVADANRRAEEFVLWVTLRVHVVDVSRDVALRAGELKKRLKIALADCMVIAVAEALKANPVFRRVEKEMKTVEPELRRLGVVFLDELEKELDGIEGGGL